MEIFSSFNIMSQLWGVGLTGPYMLSVSNDDREQYKNTDIFITSNNDDAMVMYNKNKTLTPSEYESIKYDTNIKCVYDTFTKSEPYSNGIFSLIKRTFSPFLKEEKRVCIQHSLPYSIEKDENMENIKKNIVRLGIDDKNIVTDLNYEKIVRANFPNSNITVIENRVGWKHFS